MKVTISIYLSYNRNVPYSALQRIQVMEIRTFGGGGRIRECESRLLLLGDKLPIKHLLLLPIPTTRDKKYISATGTPLYDLPTLCREGTFVAGYNIPGDLKEEMEKRGALVFEAALDEDFLLENAEITARGAVGSLLCDTRLDISDMKIGIIGYGRIC